jgi:hypothetical protein
LIFWKVHYTDKKYHITQYNVAYIFLHQASALCGIFSKTRGGGVPRAKAKAARERVFAEKERQITIYSVCMLLVTYLGYLLASGNLEGCRKRRAAGAGTGQGWVGDGSEVSRDGPGRPLGGRFSGQWDLREGLRRGQASSGKDLEGLILAGKVNLKITYSCLLGA